MLQCLDEDRVRLAVFLLKRNAYTGGKLYEGVMLILLPLLGQTFSVSYMSSFICSYSNVKKIEFLHLKQESISRFATELIPNEEEKCKCFEEGLCLGI